jgi:uncharacterized lipoprotein
MAHVCETKLPAVRDCHTVRKEIEMGKMKILWVVTLVLGLPACSSIPVTQVSVQSFELQKQGIEPKAGMAQLLGVLVDRGFDVKLSNAESGIVTTEYKKFASAGDDPPFDYYLQIRSKVRTNKDLTSIQLIPIVKEQNRLNMAAFTERELTYFTGEPDNVSELDSMSPSGWRVRGQTLFMNVVADAARAFGLSTDDIIQNVTKSPANARALE